MPRSRTAECTGSHPSPSFAAIAYFAGSSGTVTVSGSHQFETLDFQVGGYTLTGGSLTGVTGSETVLNTVSSTTTIATPLAGSLPYTKNGGGTLVLTGTNTYIEATTVNAGTLSLGNGGAAGSIANNSVNLINSTLVFNRSDNLAFNAVISGTGGALTKQGAGVLSLGGANTFTGATTVSAGTLAVTHASALGTTAGGVTVASGATLDIQNVAVGAEALSMSGTLKASTGTGAWGGSVSFSGATTIDVVGSSTELTLSGAIGGSTALTKTGVGRLVLAGASSLTGGITLSQGTLLVNSASWPNTGSAIGVASGATVGGSGVIGQALNLSSGAILEPGNAGAAGNTLPADALAHPPHVTKDQIPPRILLLWKGVNRWSLLVAAFSNPPRAGDFLRANQIFGFCAPERCI